MRRNSKKRAKQNRKYLQERISFIQNEIDEKGWITCIFCDRTVTGGPDIHHANGRDDERILNKSDWLFAHNKCHVHEYHSMSWQNIWWWEGYLERIKHSHSHIYEKEIRRMNKSDKHEKIP